MIAPVGLLGVISTRARTCGLASSSAAARSGSGTKPSAAAQGRGTAPIPAISSAMRWLKYHGVGSITASPLPAITGMASEKARLQPAVITTSSAVTAAA